MTARTLTADQVRQIAAASEAWQQEQQERLDAAGVGEHMDDGRAVIGPGLTQATLDEIRSSPTRAAFRQLIADLEPKARLELIALMWIGRGDTDDDDIVTALERAERTSDARDVDYLAGKEPSLDISTQGLNGLAPLLNRAPRLRGVRRGAGLPRGNESRLSGVGLEELR